MTSDHESNQPTTNAETPAAPRDQPPHDAVGAYLLDALPEDERQAFEAHLATCPDCRREVGRLSPVVALLPRLLELEPEVDAAAGAQAGAPARLPAPSPDLRERLLVAARAERPASAAQPLETAAPSAAKAPGADAGPPFAEPVPFPTAARPRGRIRSGVATDPAVAPAPADRRTPVPWSWRVAAALAVFAVGGIVWALALQGRLDDRQSEVKAQQTEIAHLRGQANATAYSLTPTKDGPTRAGGTLLYSLPDKAGVLLVHDLAALPRDKAYQLWYLKTGNSTPPKPGPTFTVTGKGEGVVAVSSDAPTFDAIALTAEPAGGSQAPTLPVLLQGALGGAAG